MPSDLAVIFQPSVAPLAGAWIEMHALSIDIPSALQVAPLAGAWIEILFYTTQRFGHVESPPSRGRGLKFRQRRSPGGWPGRPPRGGVD